MPHQGNEAETVSASDTNNLAGFTLFHSDLLTTWARVRSQVGFFSFDGRLTVRERPSTAVGRRDLLIAIMTGAAAATTVKAAAPETAVAEPRTAADKRRARYQPNSKEVQEFYRVARYPTN